MLVTSTGQSIRVRSKASPSAPALPAASGSSTPRRAKRWSASPGSPSSLTRPSMPPSSAGPRGWSSERGTSASDMLAPQSATVCRVNPLSTEINDMLNARSGRRASGGRRRRLELDHLRMRPEARTRLSVKRQSRGSTVEARAVSSDEWHLQRLSYCGRREGDTAGLRFSRPRPAIGRGWPRPRVCWAIPAMSVPARVGTLDDPVVAPRPDRACA